MTQEKLTTLFFDTETTGVPVKGAGPGDPRQPKLVQLAFIMIDGDGEERASVSIIVEPDGWIIPEGAAAVHGIPTEVARAYGVPLKSAIAIFAQHIMKCDLLVAHNIGFDLKIIEFALHCLGRPGSMSRIDSIVKHCTMKASKPILKLPATPKQTKAGFGPYKSPRMSEAYKFFTGKELVGAHDALVDVRACAEVYRHLQKQPEGQEVASA